MKRSMLLSLILSVALLPIFAQVSVTNDNSAAHPSSMLEVKSTNRGFLPPRLTTQQRMLIQDPAAGLVIFNTDLNCLEYYTGPLTGWYCDCPAHAQPACGAVAIAGQYLAGQPLGAGQTVAVPVYVLEPGGYQVSTNYINGYYFTGKGTFTATGSQVVTLHGSGTPQASGTNSFHFPAWSETCSFTVTTYQAPGLLLFRSGIFLHHSTGSNIWGPNGSSTSVPQEMTAYNTLHGYTGPNAVTMTEEWWAPGDNEWVTQHAFFENPSPVTGIGYYLPNNRIIVIKSCFPSSSMTGWGAPSDTLDPWQKSVFNYKWHWRHIVKAMSTHPDNFFVIWTNAPLEYYSTNVNEAYFSRQFCKWAKDTLATGLDPVFGNFPPNVYVFDFFSKLTGPDGIMLPGYAAAPGDSHPNSAATLLVAPQFVSEIFNAAIGYENTAKK